MSTCGHLRITPVALAPGQEWECAGPGWKFIRVSRGSAYWLDGVHPREINAGELVVAGPAARGIVRARQLTEVYLNSFGFDPEALCGFFTVAERQFFEHSQSESAANVQFLPSTHPLSRGFTELCGHSESEPDMVKRVEVLALALGYFIEGLARHLAVPAKAISAHDRFEKIIAEMPELELINYTPEQLSSLCGCSPRHFNRLFHARFGQSPRTRQTELRLLKARQLLDDPGSTIAQVALASGYRSASLFNTLFKRRFGMSPSEWRRKAQDAPPSHNGRG